VKDLKENRELSVTEIAKLTGKSRTTVYKILKQELNYVSYKKLVKQTNDQNDQK
jgi:predicted DNA-binding transcriptional regulator AlpA